MLVIYNHAPFDHIVIKDFMEPRQYKEVWDELVFLRLRMRGPESTGASSNKQNPSDYNKRGVGIFLEEIYRDNGFSSIAFHTRRFFRDKELTDRIKGRESKYFCDWDPENMQDSIIAQYYDDSDYYKPHTDKCLFSIITVLHQTPKMFAGGRLKFPEFDYALDIEDNTSIIFPSTILHEVEQLSIKKSGQLLGRFSVTNFVSRRMHNQNPNNRN